MPQPASPYRARAGRDAAVALAAAAPGLLALALLATRVGASPARFAPWWNDEVIYWNEIAAFAHAGLDAGYVAVNEQPPAASFSRFGPHGPVFITLYGLAARLVGWQPYTPILLNLLLVSAAAGVWLSVRRPRAWTELALPAAFWPLVLLVPMGMQEPLHFAFAFLFAAAAWRLLEGTTAASTWTRIVPLLAVASLARPSWAVMVLALGWMHTRTARSRMLLAAAAAVLLVVSQQIFAWLSAPYPGSIAYVTVADLASPGEAGEAAWRIWQRTLATAAAFLDVENGDPVEVALRYSALGIGAAAAAAVAVRRWRGTDPRPGTMALESAGIALVVPLVLVLVTGYIEGFMDFRILAPPLLYAVLLGGAVSPLLRMAWWATLLAGGTYLQSFGDLHQDRYAGRAQEVAAMRAAVAPVLEHAPGEDGWTNTVLVHVELLTYHLAGLPPGITASFALDWDDQPLPIRSRYLLLRPADIEALARRGVATDRLTPLATTSIATLYRNE